MSTKPKLITLIGLKSCGKSTVGRALAKQLQLDFIDTDTLIETNYFTQTGKHLNFREIHKRIGDTAFRAMETQAIKQLLANNKVGVIATGGGSMLNRANATILTEQTTVVYLQASIVILKHRWQKNPPTFINAENLAAELENYYQQCAALYQSLADISIPVDNKTVANIITEIISAEPLDLSTGKT